MSFEVIERLHIGNWQEARDAAETIHVVTVAFDSPHIGHIKFDLIDGPGNTLDMFSAAVDHVHLMHKVGKRILVHCHGGRSRSAAVVVAAMMKITGKNLCECYDLLHERNQRTRIHPHMSLLLLRFAGEVGQ